MKWGSTTLNVHYDTYVPPQAGVQINKIELIPGPDNTEPANVLQQGGRDRYTTSFDGFTDSYTDIANLQSDWIAGTERTFEGLNSFSMTMIITELDLKPVNSVPAIYEYSITLTEV